MSTNPKTLIGVLASHDDAEKNKALADMFREAYEDDKTRPVLTRYRFVFTGGTYERLMNGAPADGQQGEVEHELAGKIVRFLHRECGVIRLESKDRGGVTSLACMVTQRKVSILWPFFSPLTTHLLYPENLALLRLADQWHVKKLMNTGSVKQWLYCEASRDARLNLQDEKCQLELPSGTVMTAELTLNGSSSPSLRLDSPIETPSPLEACEEPRLSKSQLDKTVIALISHDEMKRRMIDFVIDYEHELIKFASILATGTTAKRIAEAAPRLTDKVKPFHSGPKGGDIEIATEVLAGRCHVVVFFVDPLNPHPHIEDIRVIFGACMIRDNVPMLSNEMQARAWVDRRVRGT